MARCFVIDVTITFKVISILENFVELPVYSRYEEAVMCPYQTFYNNNIIRWPLCWG